MKKILLIVVLFSLSTTVRADTLSGVQPSEYLFHLYFNAQAQLVPDRNFQFLYDVVPQAFSQSTVGQFPYTGQVIDLTGAVKTTFSFDVHSGKLSVYAPYLADGQKVVFYNAQNQPVLTVPVAASSFCNDDGICNTDRGENSATCPRDCNQSLPAAPATTAPPAATSSSSGVVLGITYAVVGLLLLGFLWWFLKRRSSSPTLPPSLPTPPPPPGPINPV